MTGMTPEPVFLERPPFFAPELRCADGEEERRAERHWREVGRGGGENPEDPPAPEDRERWRERRLS